MQDVINDYQRQYQDFAATHAPVDWLAQAHAKSLAQLDSKGFPTLRDENWRYTNTKPLLKQAYTSVVKSQSSVSKSELDQFDIAGLDSFKVVIVDGHINAALSSLEQPEGLTLTNLSEIIDQQPDRASKFINQQLPATTHGFIDLNTAFVRNGVWIEVAQDVQIEYPIELIFVTSAHDQALIQPRNIIIAGDNSKLNVIERYVSINDHKTLTNTITEIFCGQGAHLEHTRIQQESRKVNHLSGTFVSLDSQANFSTSTVTLGGNLTRNDLCCQIKGEGAHANMYGLYVANQRQHVDNFTQVEHQVANCTSDELYKGVLDDRARAVFHGRIYVAQDAQSTDAYQNNRTLLLSRDAEIDTKTAIGNLCRRC